jgi:hypothetical protein
MALDVRTQPLARRAALPEVPLPVAIVVASLALGFLSLLLPSAPTYDPLAWIIWGREIAHLDLNTMYGPSWKPLPVVLTTITAPLGEASPMIWVAVARAGAIAGVALAWLLAQRLAGHVAGFAAAAALALMPWWIRNGAMGNSEGIMVALVLGAVLAELRGRRGWAFALAVGAGLLRPEAWPFIALYAAWLVVQDRRRLAWVAGGLASLPILWMGPELWGSGNAFRASDRAREPNPDSPAFADNPALEVVKDALGLPPAAAIAGSVLAVAIAIVALRRRRTGATGGDTGAAGAAARAQGGPDAVDAAGGATAARRAGAGDGGRAARRAIAALPTRRQAGTALVLALFACAWIALVAVMTTMGFSGNVRYLIVPGALLVVLGGAGLVWAGRALAAVARPPRAPAAGAVAGALVLGTLFTVVDIGKVPGTLRAVAYQADLYHDLEVLVAKAGGAERLKACGQAFTGPYLVPHVAWRLGVHTSAVGLRPTGRAVVFHVRTTRRSPIAPPLSAARPNVLARHGHWLLTADCEAPR